MKKHSASGHSAALVSRRHILTVLAAGGLSTVGLSGCASVMGDQTLSVSQAQLLNGLTKEFPLSVKVANLFEVMALSPRLRLIPDQNRLGTDVDLKASSLGSQKLGTLGLSYGLRFEPSDASIRLTNLRVDHMDLDGSPVWLRGTNGNWASQLGEQLLKDVPVYKIPTEQASLIRNLGYVLNDIRVTSSGLSLNLHPQL